MGTQATFLGAVPPNAGGGFSWCDFQGMGALQGGQHEGAEERQSDAGVLYPLAPTICPEAGLVQARTFAMNRRGP